MAASTLVEQQLDVSVINKENLMLSDAEISEARKTLEGAFRPFLCKAEDTDHKARMRFKVADRTGNVVVERCVSPLDLQLNLAEIIEDTRRLLWAVSDVPPHARY